MSRLLEDRLQQHSTPGVLPDRVSHPLLMPNGPHRKKTCRRGFANNTGADQSAHPRSLISAFVIRLLESIIPRLAMNKISIF